MFKKDLKKYIKENKKLQDVCYIVELLEIFTCDIIFIIYGFYVFVSTIGYIKIVACILILNVIISKFMSMYALNYSACLSRKYNAVCQNYLQNKSIKKYKKSMKIKKHNGANALIIRILNYISLTIFTILIIMNFYK